ncbi:MAG: prepilin peptidase [Alphaproteobacteria bacterium]|nr:prepilin peptidase [Alphaproteobacteria bacterium]
MIYIIAGFIYGSLIPYMARRFAKFMPATMAYALYRLIAPTKKTSKNKRTSSKRYRNLMQKYIRHCLIWGVITAFAFYLAAVYLPSPFYIAYIAILFLLYEIDERMFLLPDLLTVPLLIVGFLYAATLPPADYIPWSPAYSSALGAAFGYMLPVLASVIIIKKYPDAFGGGDIKLLSAVGAWIGLENVPILLLISCIVFGIRCLIKRQRSGAFGPAIVISAVILLLFGQTL